MSSSFTKIPVVDLQDLFSSELADRKRVADQLGDAARNVGFVFVSGHNVDPIVIDGIRDAARQFFALDPEERMKVYIGTPSNGNSHHGYVPEGEEMFSDNPIPDRKSSFDVGRELPANHPLVLANTPFLGRNQWPDLPRFKEKVCAYYDAVCDLGDTLFRAFALALGIEEHALDHLIDCPPSNLRMIHYPSNGEATDRPGIGAHTDYECFTILLADEPGLEVLNGEGRWVDAAPIPGTFVVNIGDMLEVLSGGQFVATTHRVRPVTKERFSFPLFWTTSYFTMIRPLIQLDKADDVNSYSEVCAGDHAWREVVKTHRYLRLRAENEGINFKQKKNLGRKESSAI